MDNLIPPNPILHDDFFPVDAYTGKNPEFFISKWWFTQISWNLAILSKNSHFEKKSSIFGNKNKIFSAFLPVLVLY